MGERAISPATETQYERSFQTTKGEQKTHELPKGDSFSVSKASKPGNGDATEVPEKVTINVNLGTRANGDT